MQAYGNSKAAQIMFGEHLAGEIEARGANVKIIRFNDSSLSILIVLNIRQHFVPTTSLHPGVIYTDLYSNVPGIKFVSAIARWLSCLFVLADFTCVGCLSVLLPGG